MVSLHPVISTHHHLMTMTIVIVVSTMSYAELHRCLLLRMLVGTHFFLPSTTQLMPHSLRAHIGGSSGLIFLFAYIRGIASKDRPQAKLLKLATFSECRLSVSWAAFLL